MRTQTNKGRPIYTVAKAILLILILSGIILFNKKMNLERLISIHIAKEKENGVKGVNLELYNYNSVNPIEKFIVTDYQYLWILPEISQSFMDGQIQYLQPSDDIFADESVGFLLWTPSADDSKTMPLFIEEGLVTGKYTEIFNFEGYRFIKIR